MAYILSYITMFDVRTIYSPFTHHYAQVNNYACISIFTTLKTLTQIKTH